MVVKEFYDTSLGNKLPNKHYKYTKLFNPVLNKTLHDLAKFLHIIR
jgi:hypothetical protein